MALPSDYIAGTITLTNGSTAFTGAGTGWLAADFREGDIILDVEGGEGAVAVIQSITSNTAGVLSKEWEGATVTGAAYRMRYQWDSGRVSAQSRAAIEMLGNGNLQSFAAVTGPGVVVMDGPHSVTIKPETDFINGVAYDVQVDTLADRDAYDGQSEGFAVLVADVGDGRSALYTKASNTVGDWSDPAYITGPVGPLPDVEATVDMLPPGSTATVTPTPITGGYSLDFELPEASGFYNAGVYDIGEAYDQDDVVRHNGSSFIALQAVPAGTSPSSVSPPVDTAYWQVLAVKGQDGTGTGDVVGPASAVAHNVSAFADATGKVLEDTGFAAADLSDPWAHQAIGVPIPLWTHLAGVLAPPTNKDYRYIKLTAADAYNTGVLTGESVSGSAPLVLATATVSMSGSPINGVSVSLINTERRALRAGSSGTLEADQMQGHRHLRNSVGSTELAWISSGGAYIDPSGGGSRGVLLTASAGDATTDGVNGTPRTGTETRAKNIGATYYMRIK
jgi:hypothetical protein